MKYIKKNYHKKYFLVDKLVLLLIIATTAILVIDILYSPINSYALFFALLAIISIAIIYYFFIVRDRQKKYEEHLKAKQSQLLLEITNETISDLKQGLNVKTAGKVAKLIYEKLGIFAVAITDKKRILAFIGAGDDHHSAGKDILTKATQRTIEENKTNILANHKEIGCPNPKCPLSSAIVVPLDLNGQSVGTLKFYFHRSEEITENILTVATGLARLLSTQLALAEVSRQAELTCQAELKALRAQINPHFLFNTLNTIAVFCRTKPDEARKLLVQFADFFRKSLERNEEMVTLREEIEYLHSYLFFERARFGDKLKVIEEIDPLTRQKMVPALILQPLVENAIKHGVSPQGTIEIRIEVKRNYDNLHFTISDNGMGISEEEKERVLESGYGKGLGIGLYNINERLKTIYGSEYGLTLESNSRKGTVVRFEVPLEEDNSAQSAYC